MKTFSFARWIGIATVAGLVACGGGAGDSSPPPTAPSAAITATGCAALQGKSLGGATISSTAVVPAAAASAADPAVPEHCKVTALIEPKLNFEMRMPLSWNGKLHYSGGGGLNGSIPPADKSALAQGYVDVASDSGHTGSAIDGSFASDPVALRLFSRLSVPTVAAAAKLIVASAYGSPPTRSYFEGCSNGGKEGVITALYFPTVFDGVIAKAPALQLVPTIETYRRTARILSGIPGTPFNSAKVSLLSSSVMAACDSLDGVTDGIVSNVAACKYDVSALRCPSGTDEGNSCLSDQQVNAVKTATSRMIGGPGTPNVTSAAPFTLAGEISGPGGWGTWILGDPKTTIFGLFANSVVKQMLGGDPASSWFDYDFKANAPTVQAMNDEIGVSDPNLRPFRSAGGKLLLWHGAADPAVSVQISTEYYGAATAAVGGQAAMDSFARFYVAPGVTHCSGGTGADQTNLLLPTLDAWVTQNIAPGDLTTRRVNPATGATVLSRPLCRYPTFPRYKGSGDINEAANYSCAAS